MTLRERQDHFGTEDACQKYLFQPRWPKGFVWPQRQGKTYWTVQRSDQTAPVYECTGCGHQASLTVGSVQSRVTGTSFAALKVDSGIAQEPIDPFNGMFGGRGLGHRQTRPHPEQRLPAQCPRQRSQGWSAAISANSCA